MINPQYFRILEEINDERNRQDRLKQQGKFAKTCADDMTRQERLSVLAEEYGEVAHEVNESIGERPLNVSALRAELRQVAAVCLACLEGCTHTLGRWERLEEIQEASVGLEMPNFFETNMDRFENFSIYYARAATRMGPPELNQLAAACQLWIAALEDDVLRNAQAD